LAQLRQSYDEFVKRDAEILVVGPDSPSAFKSYWDKNQVPFAGLSDSTHKVADLYDQQVKLLKFGRMPALMIVDKEGRIRFSHYADNMRDYPELQEMLDVLDKLRQEKQEKQQT
jgi:peroxiredoxin